MTGESERERLDKWLWSARFCKTRARAADWCVGGRVRCNGVKVVKAHHGVAPGDVLTFALGRHIRVIRVLGLAEKRGRSTEAQALYEDLAPPSMETAMPGPVSVGPGGKERG